MLKHEIPISSHGDTYFLINSTFFFKCIVIFFPPHKVMKPLIMRFLRRILCWKLFNFPLRRGKAPLLRQVQLYYVVGSRSILPEEVKRGLHCSMNFCSHRLLFLCTFYQRIIYDRISNWKKQFKIPEIKI